MKPKSRNPIDEALKAEWLKKNQPKQLPSAGYARDIPVPQAPERAPPQPPKEKIYSPVSLELGPKPVLLWVTVDQLHVNPEYQRTISTTRGQTVIRGIVENFKWNLFSPLTITPRIEGGYWLIDGQHRTAAAKMRGINEVPAVLLEKMSTQEQALAFTGINGKRVAVNVYALHHALIAAGDEAALQIKRVTDAADVEIPRYPKSASINLQPNETLAIAAIRAGIKRHGEEKVIKVLQGIRKAYPTTPGKLIRDTITLNLERETRKDW